MEFFFRVDFNKRIGLGHLARCSYLSNYIEANSNHSATFILKSSSDAVPPFIELSKKALINYETLAQDAEQTIDVLKSSAQEKILIIDSYYHGATWEEIVRPYVKKLVVLDDLADRDHICDILVDCGFQRKPADYLGKVNKEAKLLLGLDYCFISEKFRRISELPSQENRIHLFFGSTVKFDVLLRYYLVLREAIADYAFNIACGDVLTSEMNEQWECTAHHNDKLFCSEPLHVSLRGCTVAVGSPGIAVWERAFLGIPGLYISVNANQVPIIQALEKLDFCKYVGPVEELQRNVQKVKDHLNSLPLVEIMSAVKGRIDGKGIFRIVEEMMA